MNRLNLSEKDEIQFIYPDEPDWSKIKEDVLIELVKDYSSEQNCATLALGELSLRDHPRVKEIACWVLSEENTDKWLKKSAMEKLM